MRSPLRKLFSSVSAAAFAVVALSASVQAQTFVGSWSVFNAKAPEWNCCAPNGPLAYTGKEAAAFLFGGIPDDYVISTVSNQVAQINNMAWYDVIRFGPNMFAEGYNQKYLGQFYGPTSAFGNDVNNAASAFVRDNLNNFDGLNYAFRVNTVVPEPSTVVLSGFGLLGLAAAARRRSRRSQA